MPVACTNLTSGVDADGNSSSTTASITPAPNKLIEIHIASRTGISTDPNIPTVTGCGLTWVQVDTQMFDSTSSSRRRGTTLRAMGVAPTTGALTIDFGGQNQTDVAWVVDELPFIDKSGVNGVGAIIQTAKASDEVGVTSITATLAAFKSNANATYAAFFDDGIGGGVATAGSGFAKVGEARSSSNVGVVSEFRFDPDTSVDISYPTVAFCGVIAQEIKAEPRMLASAGAGT